MRWPILVALVVLLVLFQTSIAPVFDVFGVGLNDGTPLRSVEVRGDDGPWHPATLDSSMQQQYSWKFFNHVWNGATRGEHTIVSRVTDATGKIQPTEAELVNKKTFREDNAQYPRTVMIA